VTVQPGEWRVLECRSIKKQFIVGTFTEYLCWLDITEETTGYVLSPVDDDDTEWSTGSSIDNKFSLDPTVNLNNGISGGLLSPSEFLTLA